MKCPHCGAPLKMEDKFCTYCGAPNTLAMQHQADMEHYKKEFAQTQEEVLNKSRKAGSLTGYLVVLIILIVLNIVAAFFSSNAWNIKYERRRTEAAGKADVHKAELDKMIENQDYFAMRTYYYNNRLSGVDAFVEYEAVTRYAGQLADIFTYLCNTDKYGYWKSEKGVENTVTSMSSDIISLYENPLSSYYDEKAVTEEKLEIIEDIRRQAEALLITYAGFTEEETQELRNMSKSRIEDTLREHLTAIREDRQAAESADESFIISPPDESFSHEVFLDRRPGGNGV